MTVDGRSRQRPRSRRYARHRPHGTTVTGQRPAGDTGPGILETSIVIAASILLAAIIVMFFGGQLGQLLGILVDLAHGGH